VRLRTRREGVAAAFADQGQPKGRIPWRQACWCALDLELTGLDPDSDDIIAIGAVPIEDGRVLLGESRYTLVRTSKRSEHGAVLMHKLRVADLAEAPPLERALEMVLELLTGRVPVFHTAAVERSFLGPPFARRHVRLPAAADTEALGRLLLRRRDGQAPPRLPLARLTGLLNQSGEAPHHALADALTTAQAFIALARLLEAFEPQTVGSLTGAAQRLGGGRRFGPL
jgi:DNA polymerase III subunit epsilon